jgi:hypothetical protein
LTPPSESTRVQTFAVQEQNGMREAGRGSGTVAQKRTKWRLKMKKTLAIASQILILLPSLAFSSLALAQQTTQSEEQQAPDKLVETVRNSTTQYLDDTKAATAAGYSPALGCVSGPDHGAMGVHYVNTSLVNGPIDPTHPQALIYEPTSNGQYKLVAVEFIILAGALPPNSAPQVAGHLMQFIDAPNRYGLPAFFELHVWAWKDNPQGPFVDWNNHVSCAHQ